jgi:hypothetical protein
VGAEGRGCSLSSKATVAVNKKKEDNRHLRQRGPYLQELSGREQRMYRTKKRQGWPKQRQRGTLSLDLLIGYLSKSNCGGKNLQ